MDLLFEPAAQKQALTQVIHSQKPYSFMKQCPLMKHDLVIFIAYLKALPFHEAGGTGFNTNTFVFHPSRSSPLSIQVWQKHFVSS